MKTANTITRTLLSSRAVAATILLAAVLSANAQYRPSGDDGITASPKVRAQLDERKAKATPIVAAGDLMACAKCKNAWVTQSDTTSKGAGARTLMGQGAIRVAQHLCEGCSTDWTTKGAGKAKATVATHKCTSCGSENLACCGKGPSNVATKGMEKNPVEVAPLK